MAGRGGGDGGLLPALTQLGPSFQSHGDTQLAQSYPLGIKMPAASVWVNSVSYEDACEIY